MADRETGFFRGAGGVIWEMDLPLPEVMADQLTKGYLTRVAEDGSPYVESVAEEEPGVELPPAANASKAHWIGYAVRVHNVRPDDAEAMTKNDLIEKYGPR
ncbi:hypothetical protein IMZ11_02340 [Microtetraspora sp. AC03309]|uniref:hypothetical protein n=1 Tax=Microtetraspora sp. AC03309 TaxID=2779376 RepID=UPI001E2F2DB9|nr:hypothetical protein [Microtetraspora sp. AC03309]MCC5574480.1 hypothetical protein [Microtetraspora sp. AC03309]